MTSIKHKEQGWDCLCWFRYYPDKDNPGQLLSKSEHDQFIIFLAKIHIYVNIPRRYKIQRFEDERPDRGQVENLGRA